MNFEHFDNINYENLKALINLIKDKSLNISDLKLFYSRDYQFLQENLNFLINLNFLKIEKNIVTINYRDQYNLREKLIELIFSQPDLGAQIKNYISNFTKNENGRYLLKPTDFYNIQTSSLRNLLITMKYIKNIGNEYLIIDESIISFAKSNKFSPEQLKKLKLAQEKLGLAAEKIILKYEKDKLQSLGLNVSPKHISLDDVSAGYDIESFNIINSQPENIYIEVKAVSQSNYQFHLSAQEYQTADRLKDLYYIYLLPVDYSHETNFNINNLLKINNIHENIFNNKNAWKISNDGFLISKT